MGSPSCPSPEQLRAFHLGDLPEASLDAIASHLDLCPRCETLARQLDTQVDGVLKAIRAAAAEGAPASRALAAPDRPPRPHTSTQRYPFLQPPTQEGDLGRLANYRVLRLLGAGGMGYVFQAEDLILRRGVALKVMKPNLTPDADGWERFTREARVMASLRHRHLATVYQAGEENGAVYLAMELLEGETLESRLGRLGRLPVPEVLRLGQEIAGGLAVVHAPGLIHRDIKPDNIWLEANGDNVKILDFGLARCIKDKARLTHTGMVMGTPAYMSPEQAAGRPLDARSDLFSLGVVLYRACSGREPFDGHNTMAMLAALAVATARPLREITRDIPPGLSDLVSRLLRRDPNERPASAQEVMGELKSLASEVPWPVSAVAREPRAPLPANIPEAPPRLRTSRKKRKQRQPFFSWPWLVGGAGALLLGVIIVLACWPPRGNPPPEPPAHGPGLAGPVEPVNPVEVNGDVVYLTALTPADQVKWFSSPPAPPGRPPPPGAEAGGNRVIVGGKASAHGIFMHGAPPHLGGGPSSITYRLNGTFRTFEADVSLNDGPPYSQTAITFSLYDGAGRRLWRSKPVTSQKDTQHVSVAIENVDVLKLEIRCADEQVGGSHAVWIEPRLKR